MEDFIRTNPLDCLEVQTKISLYTVMLSDNYLEMMAERFCGELKSELLEELDPVGLRELRGQLCEKLGGTEKMGRIDQLFRQSFMMVSPLSCWLQGAADALLGDLISRDRESGMLNFQLLVAGKA